MSDKTGTAGVKMADGTRRVGLVGGVKRQQYRVEDIVAKSRACRSGPSKITVRQSKEHCYCDIKIFRPAPLTAKRCTRQPDIE
jgi:hypothetical protein